MSRTNNVMNCLLRLHNIIPPLMGKFALEHKGLKPILAQAPLMHFFNYTTNGI
jgi:hypothetical protein